MKNLIFFFAILLSFPLNAQTATDTLTSTLEKIAKTTNVPGFAVAIVKKDGSL